ncbi:hypothetical protein [Streptomyces yaizuensis]|uniref:FXSXX-COOH protein n=1 Tax=Streptomyces yaizuensis TaxID=2989713 RepID=A0ABQ5P915_9ACTN|nr:hypothetical protein [Streptomyces sp. YSPA8]GLF98751.1 hypothetical protein SYYSPA8_30660 [Streptomyces sp. YSPA8]
MTTTNSNPEPQPRQRDGTALALTALTLIGPADPTLILGDHVHQAAQTITTGNSPEAPH